MIPTKLLYLGAAGEHHVMSECFRHQREAFKLPVDRGFDLVVTDAHRHLAKAEIGASNTYPPSPDGPPLYLQVKSRQAHPVAPAAEAGDDRPRWEGSFTIKASDLRLICETPNAFLVCVLFIDISDQLSKARTAYAWWMSSAKVKQLRDSKHFIKSKSSGEELELHACYVEPAPNAPYVQNSYIALFKQHQGKDAVPGQLSSSERIPKDCFDFRKLSAS
ncbi:MAG: hypothetical protein EKK45_01245 [Curvibacter sp.]|jgi:hypothetical protein|nr:MAG: hypothetical protein EKK45_01245 [Curvibacter sp.]